MPTLASPPEKSQRLATARGLLLRGSGPEIARVPRRATADQKFIAAARNYRRCAKELIQAITAHQQFAATQPYDDAGHHDHHQRVVAARQALIGAEVAFEMADAALAKG